MFCSASLNRGKSWIMKVNFSLKAKSCSFDHILRGTNHLQWLEIWGCSYFQLWQLEALRFVLFMCWWDKKPVSMYLCVCQETGACWEPDLKLAEFSCSLSADLSGLFIESSGSVLHCVNVLKEIPSTSIISLCFLLSLVPRTMWVVGTVWR